MQNLAHRLAPSSILLAKKDHNSAANQVCSNRAVFLREGHTVRSRARNFKATGRRQSTQISPGHQVVNDIVVTERN